MSYPVRVTSLVLSMKFHTDFNFFFSLCPLFNNLRVATVREKYLEKCYFFQVREKSGNFVDGQEIQKGLGKVREFETYPQNFHLLGALGLVVQN